GVTGGAYAPSFTRIGDQVIFAALVGTSKSEAVYLRESWCHQRLLGWSLLPESMVKGDDLRVLDIRELKLSRQLGAVTHKDRTLSNAAKAMVEACQASR
ncbi:MAG: LysR family transcriptional regulator substrate-binding protein, partial [Sedimenticola sp.]